MWYCKDCLSNSELRNDLNIFLCGDWYNDNTVCTHCGGSNIVIFDGTFGCEGCPMHHECIPD